MKELMKALSTDGNYEISEEMKAELADFYGNYASEAETAEAEEEYEETEEEAITAISHPSSSPNGITIGYYNLQGMPLTEKPQSGVYIEIGTDAKGKLITRKVVQ